MAGLELAGSDVDAAALEDSVLGLRTFMVQFFTVEDVHELWKPSFMQPRAGFGNLRAVLATCQAMESEPFTGRMSLPLNFSRNHARFAVFVLLACAASEEALRGSGLRLFSRR